MQLCQLKPAHAYSWIILLYSKLFVQPEKALLMGLYSFVLHV